MEPRCEIDNDLMDDKSRAPEANLTMQNILPLSIVRTAITNAAKTTSMVPNSGSCPILKNTKDAFPADWLGKLPFIEGDISRNWVSV